MIAILNGVEYIELWLFKPFMNIYLNIQERQIPRWQHQRRSLHWPFLLHFWLQSSLGREGRSSRCSSSRRRPPPPAACCRRAAAAAEPPPSRRHRPSQLPRPPPTAAARDGRPPLPSSRRRPSPAAAAALRRRRPPTQLGPQVVWARVQVQPEHLLLSHPLPHFQPPHGKKLMQRGLRSSCCQPWTMLLLEYSLWLLLPCGLMCCFRRCVDRCSSSTTLVLAHLELSCCDRV